MTSAAGVDLNRAASGGADSLRVESDFLISLDHANRYFSAQLADRALEQRRLARTRRTHQIERDDLATFEPAAVVLGQMIIFRENILLELKRARVRMFVSLGTIVMMMLVSIVRVIMMMIAVVVTSFVVS